VTTRIAFIGLGIMGASMARHLLSDQTSLTVFNRTRSKAVPLADAGATVAKSPGDAAREADFIFLCLTDTSDVEAVLFGDNGVAKTAKPGSIVVDHSTVSPVASKEWAKRLAAKQVGFIDAPVSGGDVGARNAALSIMCGGPADHFNRVKPLLERMGKTITHCGPAGSGQATKLVNQVLVLGTLAAVCEGMRLVETGGLDAKTTLVAVGGGAAKSWQLENLAPKIAASDYAPGFRIDLARKDLRLVREYANASGVKLPGIERVQLLYESIKDTHDRDGTQALIEAMRTPT
jgi:3-hydroxyisobutyrate dehydrogenase